MIKNSKLKKTTRSSISRSKLRWLSGTRRSQRGKICPQNCSKFMRSLCEVKQYYQTHADIHEIAWSGTWRTCLHVKECRFDVWAAWFWSRCFQGALFWACLPPGWFGAVEQCISKGWPEIGVETFRKRLWLTRTTLWHSFRYLPIALTSSIENRTNTALCIMINGLKVCAYMHI